MTKTALISRYLIVLILAVAMTTAFSPGGAQAATMQGYQISPPVTTLALDPGTSTRQTIKVTNLTNEQLTLQVGKRNFVAKGEEGEVELTDDANPLYSLAPYFTLSQPTISVPPRGTSELTYTLSVPRTAEPGGRYGSVTFNTIATKLPTGQSGASVRQELAALIFLRINGAAHEQLAIDSFTTGQSFYEQGPVHFATRVKNLGNVHARPTGEVVVTNLLGFRTATIKVDEKNVIPGAVRKLKTEFKRQLMFGRYTATITLKNGTMQTLTAKTTFTVIPYKLIGLVLIILLVIGWPLWRGRRRWARAIRILAGRE